MPNAPMTATAATPAATIPIMLPDAIPEEAEDDDDGDGEMTVAGDDEVNGRLLNVDSEAAMVVEVVGEAYSLAVSIQIGVTSG